MNTKTENATIHVCIATGQNAANFIPLEQYAAEEVWILETPSMKASATNLALALRGNGRSIERKRLDDSSPATLTRSAEEIAVQLDGRHVVLHATGGTKLMVLALRDGLGYIETGDGRLDIVYADTQHQRVDWLGGTPRSEAMVDVIDLKTMLLLQGYRIEGDNRHQSALERASAPGRVGITRMLGDGAGKYGSFLSALASRANRACADQARERDLWQRFEYAPGGAAAKLLRKAADARLLRWDEDLELQFADVDAAAYFAGGWIEEYALLKLKGSFDPERFSSNLQVKSAGHGVPNELDAMAVHRNRALVIECKTGRQDNAAAALYKLAQLRDQLGGSVATALYLSAQPLKPEQLERARDYRIEVLHAGEVVKLSEWLRSWKER